ncbi:glycine zipper 2TM domain-containing protein [Croceicoccus marinus]|jgi:hypothetical protein|uniref:17 kDa surface antigen n=1 Tax=Croceicoccus marinus TaxID=450378 RepID=A0A7G6VX35_9SPHN|nr:glycine zipper 2TM domain-containing protein [Croceicoccus marinus]QNE06300.1 hypothetical protein H4O24_06770 [Croceicoccus marinus]
MAQFLKLRTLALAAAVPAMALSAPAAQAAAFPMQAASVQTSQIATVADVNANHDRRNKHRDRDRYGRYDRYDRYDSRYDRYDRDERVRGDSRVWRGDDGRYYCKKENGTTGLLIGGAVGGLAGHEILKDKTMGAILGAAGGALLGRAIDKSDARCR